MYKESSTHASTLDTRAVWASFKVCLVAIRVVFCLYDITLCRYPVCTVVNVIAMLFFLNVEWRHDMHGSMINDFSRLLFVIINLTNNLSRVMRSHSPCRFFPHSRKGNLFCGAICRVSNYMFSLPFASYIAQYMHINVHFINKREGWSTFTRICV